MTDAIEQKPGAMPVGCTALLGRALFAPGQHPHYVEIKVCADKKALRGEHSGNGWDDDINAFCAFNYDSEGPKMGELVFEKSFLTRPNVVHECTHAALSFAELSMQSDAVQQMSENEQAEYYHEAVPRMTEALFAQVDAIVWPNAEVSHSFPETVRDCKPRQRRRGGCARNRRD